MLTIFERSQYHISLNKHLGSYKKFWLKWGGGIKWQEGAIKAILSENTNRFSL